MYFLNCDDNSDLGQDHYVYTPNGVHHLFVKSHKDYKSGLEPTQFRLSIEGKTYYLMTNVVSGMGELYDANGLNLDTTIDDPQRKRLDLIKNKAAIDYYMKVLVGSATPSSTVLAKPAEDKRLIQAEACIRREILKMGDSLAETFKSIYEPWKTPEKTRTERLDQLQEVLRAPACTSDPEISARFESRLTELRSQK
jgi:hypothetical protein